MATNGLSVAAGAVLFLIGGCATDERLITRHALDPVPPGAEYTPPAAISAGQEGWVILSCVMAEGRRPAGCKVAQEYPLNWGFGDAALRLSEVTTIAADEAVPIGESFRYPIAFCMPWERTCSTAAVRERLIAHRAKLGPIFPGEQTPPEVGADAK